MFARPALTGKGVSSPGEKDAGDLWNAREACAQPSVGMRGGCACDGKQHNTLCGT